LPDLGLKDVVETYRLESSWDGRSSFELSQEYLPEIRCTVRTGGRLAKNPAYFAVVGDKTYWMDNASPYQNRRPDYDCDILMLIEANPKRGPWYESRDLSMAEALELLTSEPSWDWNKPDGHFANEMAPWRAFFYKPSITRNVAMADGSVRTLYPPLPKHLAKAILTRQQDPMDRQELDFYSRPRLDYKKIWSFSAFCIIAILPVLSRKDMNSSIE
jgi:prepilin-type processing-associated H-X9-DG protein